ncbi:MAG: hypothetical protein R6X22_03005 [Gemmatimonadota bacterium]
MPVLAPVRAPFRALCVAFVPDAAGLDEDGWSEVEAAVERALADRPATVGRQVALLVRVVDLFARLRHGRSLSRLPLGRRVALLTGLQDAVWPLLRRGIWGLRTLAFLGYYTRPAAAASIGYRADPGGWEARR